jgi:hypothetical protein
MECNAIEESLTHRNLVWKLAVFDVWHFQPVERSLPEATPLR